MQQCVVGEAVGRAGSAVWQWERRARCPHHATVANLEAVLELEPGSLAKLLGFGGQIEANWEIRRVRLYSSRDAAGLQDLMLDPRWSSEGLFASLKVPPPAEHDTASRVTVPQLDAEA